VAVVYLLSLAILGLKIEIEFSLFL